ncbi:MAG: DUF5829 family protein [Saprospiraceae bacterium]|nr:DUF5829 family protein [Saprospiraceae bacterium]
MKRLLMLSIFLAVGLAVQTQAQDCSVVLNHFLLVVDSATYQAVLESEVVDSDFAFAYEKNKNWEGIYIIGQDNYIEIFHPNSIEKEQLPIGFTWICQASLVANCIKQYDLPKNKKISYSVGKAYDDLSVKVGRAKLSKLFTTWEMNKKQYESWTKKKYHKSLIFQTTDYNSPAESDSSKNYLFKNVTGIQVNLNPKDSLSVTQYLKLIGYELEARSPNGLKFTNSIDFVELHFSEKVELASISTIYFALNQTQEERQILLGNTEILLDGNTGRWEIGKPMN